MRKVQKNPVFLLAAVLVLALTGCASNDMNTVFGQQSGPAPNLAAFQAGDKSLNCGQLAGKIDQMDEFIASQSSGTNPLMDAVGSMAGSLGGKSPAAGNAVNGMIAGQTNAQAQAAEHMRTKAQKRLDRLTALSDKKGC